MVIEAYITSAYRAYEIAGHYRAKGCYVAMGGLHVTSMPDEALRFADSIYTQKADAVLEEITELEGRHLYFLDDHLFGNSLFAETLFEGMTGMGRYWQAAGTVEAVMKPGLMEKAVRSGLRSLFIGFETLNPRNLCDQSKYHNLKNSYEDAIKRLHCMGVMVNASFIFGLDCDDASVFSRTVEWAVNQAIETATFHILTPYPGTKLHERLRRSGRIRHTNWDLYDTRHAVFNPNGMSVAQLEQGYWQAYADFYSWKSIIKSATAKIILREKFRHLAYTGGWKKFEGLWGKIIQMNRIYQMRPLLEAILSGSGTFNVKRKGKKCPPRLDSPYL